MHYATNDIKKAIAKVSARVFSNNSLWNVPVLNGTYFGSVINVWLFKDVTVFTVYGIEYAFGAHDYPTSGIFEVEPRTCPGFKFRKSIYIGTTCLDPIQVRDFMERQAANYHGDSYHLIVKNCNHFCEDVCRKLTGKCIPKWINRLARIGKCIVISLASNACPSLILTKQNHSQSSSDLQVQNATAYSPRHLRPRPCNMTRDLRDRTAKRKG